MNSQAEDQEQLSGYENEVPFHENAFAFSPDFPIIRNLSDVLPHIRPDSGIKSHVWADRFVGINYAITAPETFQTALDLECRGLVFDAATGELLSRPLHKLFQIGERQSISDLDFNQEVWAEKKLDGSMIAAFVNGNPMTGPVVFHTRGGIYSQANDARRAAPEKTIQFARDVFNAGFTPTFEWTSPSNRIVLHYEHQQLTLLNVRERLTGKYLSRSEIVAWAAKFDVPVAEIHKDSISGPEGLRALIDEVRKLRGEEGVIVAFENGNRIKIKAEEYLHHHKIISDIESEKNAQKAWIENSIDDVSAILGDHRGVALRAFGADMDRVMFAMVTSIEQTLSELDGLDAKARAKEIQTRIPKPLVSAAFCMAKGMDGMEQMRRIMSWGHISLEKMDLVREVFDLPSWECPG